MGAMLQAIAVWLSPLHLIEASFGVFILAAAISYGFELFSKITGHGHYEIADAVASIIGAGIGMALVFALVFAF